MKKITKNELEEILEKHRKYLNGERDGECADLSYTDLSFLDFSQRILCYIDFSHTNLNNTNFSHANLFCANLSFANLTNTNFSSANLCNAILDNVKYNNSTTFLNLVCPEEGSFIGFKKVKYGIYECIAKLLITDDSKRSSATTRKCRASKVKVLGFYDYDKNELPFNEVHSKRDNNFIYHKGETIEIEDFDENRWLECSTGIHFFLTFDEAKNYHF